MLNKLNYFDLSKEGFLLSKKPMVPVELNSLTETVDFDKLERGGCGCGV